MPRAATAARRYAHAAIDVSDGLAELDPARQVTAKLDPLNNQTTMGYNSRGWMTQLTDPTGGALFKAYS